MLPSKTSKTHKSGNILIRQTGLRGYKHWFWCSHDRFTNRQFSRILEKTNILLGRNEHTGPRKPKHEGFLHFYKVYIYAYGNHTHIFLKPCFVELSLGFSKQFKHYKSGNSYSLVKHQKTELFEGTKGLITYVVEVSGMRWVVQVDPKWLERARKADCLGLLLWLGGGPAWGFP